MGSPVFYLGSTSWYSNRVSQYDHCVNTTPRSRRVCFTCGLNSISTSPSHDLSLVGPEVGHHLSFGRLFIVWCILWPLPLSPYLTPHPLNHIFLPSVSLPRVPTPPLSTMNPYYCYCLHLSVFSVEIRLRLHCRQLLLSLSSLLR